MISKYAFYENFYIYSFSESSLKLLKVDHVLIIVVEDIVPVLDHLIAVVVAVLIPLLLEAVAARLKNDPVDVALSLILLFLKRSLVVILEANLLKILKIQKYLLLDDLHLLFLDVVLEALLLMINADLNLLHLEEDRHLLLLADVLHLLHPLLVDDHHLLHLDVVLEALLLMINADLKVLLLRNLLHELLHPVLHLALAVLPDLHHLKINH